MPYAVITGATRGIGHAIAKMLLKEGFSVVLTGRDSNMLDQLKQEWGKQYPQNSIFTFRADLSVRSEADALGDHILAHIPEIDILVNNAGSFRPGSLCNEADGLLEEMINTNLYSAYHLTRKLAPAMIARGKGHIFNMCSVASLRAYPNGGSYSISKYALMGFSENLREELKHTGIRVTSVCPGATYTSSWAGSGVLPERIMEANDIALTIWGCYRLSERANVDTIVVRPVKGDL